MKYLTFFRLAINKTSPRDCNTIIVKKVDVAAINSLRLVIKDDEFTRVTLDKTKAVDYHELSKVQCHTLSIEDGNYSDGIYIEMYCHHQSRADFIRYCNEILAVSKDYSNYYVNSLGDVQEVTHDND